jgi:putative transposase
MDFVLQRLPDGRQFEVLTIVDQFTRECLTLFADTALTGEKVATALDKVVNQRGTRQSITVDNGTVFASKAMGLWAYKNGVHLDLIRRGKPVENDYIESFNGKLREECLDVEVFFTLADARHKLALWRQGYNHNRPHSAFADRTPNDFATICSRGKDGGRTALENAARFPLSLRTTAAGFSLKSTQSSSLLLEAEISILLRLSFPGRVNRPNIPVSCGAVFWGGQPCLHPFDSRSIIDYAPVSPLNSL